MMGPIARATVVTTAVLGLRLVAQAGTLLIVARMLGPRQFGAFAGIAALAVLLGSFSTFGMHLIMLREMSKSPKRRDVVAPLALGTTLACGTTMLVMYLAIVWFVLRPVAIGPEVVLCIGLAELLVQPLRLLASVEQQARGNIARSQLQVNAPLFLRLSIAVTIWAVQAPQPLETYAWGYLVASVLALFIGPHSLKNAWRTPASWKLPRGPEWRDAGGFAVLNLTALAPTELDKTLALRLLPLAAAGVYSATARVVGAAVLPVIALMLAALPRLFREADQGHSTRLSRWIFAASAVYGVIASIGLWFAAPSVEWLFGPQYQGSTEILRWLTIAVPGMALRFAGGSALMARKSPWWRAAVEILGLCVLCMTALLLIPDNAVHAMPIALASAEWSMAITCWLLVVTRVIGRSEAT